MSRERLVCVDPRTSCRILGQKTRNLQQIPPCLVSKFSVKNKLPNAAVIDGILIELTVVLPSTSVSVFGEHVQRPLKRALSTDSFGHDLFVTH